MEKPWKIEAVIRACLTLFVCQFLGAMAMAGMQFFSRPLEANPWLVGALMVGSTICCGVGLYIIRKPWEFEHFSRQFLLLILFIYLGLTLGAFVQYFAGKSGNFSTVLRVLFGALCFQGVLLVILPRFLREHEETWQGAFGWRTRPVRAVCLGAVAGLIFFKLGEILQALSMKIISALGSEPKIQPAVEALKAASSGVDLLAFGLVAVVLAPVGEELLFRGILYPAIKRLGYPRLALWGRDK